MAQEGHSWVPVPVGQRLIMEYSTSETRRRPDASPSPPSGIGPRWLIPLGGGRCGGVNYYSLVNTAHTGTCAHTRTIYTYTCRHTHTVYAYIQHTRAHTGSCENLTFVLYLTWLRKFTWPLTAPVTLGKSLNLFDPPFDHLWNEDDKRGSPHPRGVG